MGTLQDADRVACRREFMAELAENFEELGLTKAEMKAAIDAIDQWVDANAASFNQALPLPARTTLSAGQKARALALVLRKRFVKGV